MSGLSSACGIRPRVLKNTAAGRFPGEQRQRIGPSTSKARTLERNGIKETRRGFLSVARMVATSIQSPDHPSGRAENIRPCAPDSARESRRPGKPQLLWA